MGMIISASRDVGVYNTCPMGCLYCYATRDASQARCNHRIHDPNSPSLVPPIRTP